MQRARGPWLAALLLAVAGAIVVVSWSGGSRRAVVPRPAGGSDATSAAPRSSGGTVESRDGSDRDSRSAADAAIEAARAADAVDPLAPPEPQEIDAIESEGRVQFWGAVTAPDGQPCAGATIWHDGKPVGRSDERGHYRVVVDQCAWDLYGFTSYGFNRWLHARKEGVGIAQQFVSGASRRVDFRLAPGFAISGRVRRRGSDEAVAGARVELQLPIESPWGKVKPLLRFETTCDAAGRFEFATQMGSRIALRASAEEWASCGWFEFGVDPQKGREGIDFELEPRLAAKGWFVPWPPPGVGPAEAAGAEIVAVDAQVGSRSLVDEPARSPVAADGTFRVRFAATLALELRVEVAGGIAWRRALDLPWEPRDVDLGRIELAAPARVRGEAALPPELLELGFELLAVIRAADGLQSLRAPVGLDGRFVSPPLPGGFLTHVAVVLGNEVAIPLSLRHFDPRFDSVSGKGEGLAPGEMRDVGRVAPEGALMAGRVRSARGDPVVDTTVGLGCGQGEESDRIETQVDAAGRYLFFLPSNGSDEWFDQAAKLGRWRANARRHGAHVAVDLAEPPIVGAPRRLDLELGEGARAAGRILDEAGEPLGRARIALLRIGIDIDGSLPQIQSWTDGDGRFVATGLSVARYAVMEGALDGSLRLLGEIDAPCADITLTRRTGDPADGE